MARNYAQIFTRVWADEDFLALSGAAQRMYFLLLSQSNLDHAGVVPLQKKRWAKLCAKGTVAAVGGWLTELADHRYVVIDEDTEELLIRSYIRNGELWRQPNLLTSALRDASGTLSRTLRRTLSEELARIPLDEMTGKRAEQTKAQVTSHIETLSGTPSEGFPEPISEGIPEGSGIGTGIGKELKDRTSVTHVQDSATKIRDDVERLCSHLADRIEGNGSKRPEITKAWRDAARLMLDKDGRTEQQVRTAIDWCQADDFWRANVLSMPKLREKYDQLRLQARRRNGRADQPDGPRRHDDYNEISGMPSD